MMEENGKRQKNNREKNSNNIIKVIVILIIIALIIIGIILVVNNKKKDDLIGNWSVDGLTVLEFDGKGNGILKVPTDEYKFTYIIHNNEIYIDYESDDTTDSDYEYSFENSKLVLKGIKATTGTYTLTKQ